MTRADAPTPRPAAAAHSRRDQVLTMLRESPVPLDIGALAERLGAHPNTVRFHLDALTAAGRVERVVADITGPGRPPHLYRARREMDRNGPSNYRLLARIMTSQLAATQAQPTAAAIALGRRWGPTLVERAPRRATSRTAALTRLTAVLGELGFKPQPIDGRRAKQVRLRHCPFLDIIGENADVICGLHLGLMQGALAAMGAPVTVDRLERFVEPDLCVGHLAATRTPA